MPTGYTTVAASHLQDATGTLIANATICFSPVDNNGKNLSFRIAGATSGQSISKPVTATVTNGSFSIVLADTSLTVPVNVGYAVTVVDNVTGFHLLGSGYGCVQPTGDTWSFDAYTPNLASQVTVQTGPQGQGLNNRGTWAANTAYAPYDFFSYDGNTYIVPTGGGFTSGTSFSATGLQLFGRAGTDGATTPNFEETVTFPAAQVGSGSSSTAMSSEPHQLGVLSVSDFRGYVVFKVDKVTGQTKAYLLNAGTVLANLVEAATLTATSVNATDLVIGTGTGATQIASANTNKNVLAVSDSRGFTVFGIDKISGKTKAYFLSAGTVVATALEAATVQATELLIGVDGAQIAVDSTLSDTAILGVSDFKGNRVFKVNKTNGHTRMSVADVGTVNAGAIVTSSLTVTPITSLESVKGLSLDYEMMYVGSYGQSLSNGVSGDPAVSTTSLYDSLKFVGGVVANQASTDPSVIYASLVPLTEDSWTTTSTAVAAIVGVFAAGETPISGALDTVKSLLIRENGLHPTDKPYQFIGSAPGRGGASISLLGQGSPNYNILLEEVTKAKAFATALGKSFGVPAIFWTQGEADAAAGVSLATYVAEQTTLFTNLNADIKAITGQAKDVVFITYQTFGGPTYTANAFNIACAQLQVAATMPNVFVATPCYPFGHAPASGESFPNTTNPHLLPQDYRQMGAYYGKWFKRKVVEGDALLSYANQKWNPLDPNRAKFSVVGTRCVITLPLDQTPLQIDTANYTGVAGAGGPAPNYGFALTDASGATVAITVTLCAQDSISIVAAEPITSGFTLTYGASPGGSDNGGWGNIRDNQGAIDTVTVAGLGLFGGSITLPLHNWLRLFSHTF